MYTLWSVRVDGGNGKELYGDDYADIYAISRLHYKAASPVECDHVSRATRLQRARLIGAIVFYFSVLCGGSCDVGAVPVAALFLQKSTQNAVRICRLDFMDGRDILCERDEFQHQAPSCTHMYTLPRSPQNGGCA